jgi:hypothetical protein
MGVTPGCGVLAAPVGGTAVMELGVTAVVGEGMLMPGVIMLVCWYTAVCVWIISI